MHKYIQFSTQPYTCNLYLYMFKMTTHRRLELTVKDMDSIWNYVQDVLTKFNPDNRPESHLYGLLHERIGSQFFKPVF